MRLNTLGPVHLTYCTNVHPGDSWDEVRAALDGPVAEVGRRVSPGARFGVGLRLGGRPLRELMGPVARAELDEVLERNGLYVFSLNAFPFGAFHARGVKEAVYRPDWLEHARLAYTCRAADLLASLLPEGVVGFDQHGARRVRRACSHRGREATRRGPSLDVRCAPR